MGASFIRLRSLIKGVTWKHPFIHLLLVCLDPMDAVIRMFRGYGKLPRLSVRVRSTGIRNELGGRQYYKTGQFFLKILRDHARLQAGSRVLEIGCGSGRAALALSEFLEDGKYVGMDIEKISLLACRGNKILQNKKFQFDLMNIYSKEYNPEGIIQASAYRFPYPDQSFEVIFLTSVFTHMLPDTVSNYVTEIGRMLTPGGCCLFTTFVMDAGTEGYGISFPYATPDYCLFQKTFPEKAVGYYLHYFDGIFKKAHCKRSGEPILGPWRNVAVTIQYPRTDFAQDILVYEKQGSTE
jgi:SAM-dependent methyltransferase